MPSRPRTAPCFCGSGRAFGSCCLRAMRPVGTVSGWQPACRWRIWRVFGVVPPRLAFREAAEHVCSGVYLWIGRTSRGQASWMVDDEPQRLLAVLEQLPAEPAEWVVAQTLRATAPALIPGARVMRGSVDDLLATVRMRPHELLELDPAAAEVAGLAGELVSVARAGSALAAQLRQALEAPEDEGRTTRADGNAKATDRKRAAKRSPPHTPPGRAAA